MARPTPGPWSVGFDCAESGWVDIHGNLPERLTPIIASARLAGEHAINQANARLMAAAPQLLEALTRAEVFFARPDEGASEHFERIAEAFRKATGIMVPGKDAGMHGGASYQERVDAYDDWLVEQHIAIRAAIAAATGAP